MKIVGVIHGPQTEGQLVRARAAAAVYGIQLREITGSTPGEVISSLRRMSPEIQGIWLLPDLEILTRQVVQYSLGLQLQRHIPLMGAARRHAEQGALFAMDYEPRNIGRQAARLAGAHLTGDRPPVHQQMVPILTVNRSTARTIGLDADQLERLADVVVP
jgi:putative ABC transport system substrate-binding protein